jgi:hypothetical protein
VKLCYDSQKPALLALLFFHEARASLLFPVMNATVIRTTLQQQIETIREAGWALDARCLQNDLDRSGDCLPELLMTRDSVEEFLEGIAE